MTRRFGPWSWGRVPAIVGLSVVLIATAASAGEVKPAHWVSDDAAVYLEISHPGQLLDRINGDSFQKTLKAIPAYTRYLKSDNYAKFRQVVDFISGQLDTTWDKGLRDLAGGGLVLAVEAPPGNAPRALLAVSPGDPAFLKRASAKLIEIARKDAADKGKPDPVKDAEFRGVTTYALEKGAYAILDETLVIADRLETLKTVIDRARDGAKAGKPITESAEWKARHDQVPTDALAWGVLRLDRLRKLDPKKFTVPDKEKTPPQVTFFFGSWVEALRKSPWVAASLSWTESRLAAELHLPAGREGYLESLKGFVPPKGSGAPGLVNPPGTIASLSLWRDLSAVWEARTELLPPQAVQNLAQLDTFAGQFFGGRDFGSGVLGALSSDWRLVVARQNLEELKPLPDVKLPAFALIVDLKPDDDEFAQRLKVAFQSFIGLANIGAAQSKSPPLEQGSETFEGVTIATTRFMVPKPSADEGESKEPVHTRHNFSPSIALVGNHFILGSSLGLTRNLVKAIKSPPPATDATLALEADGAELARLVEVNRNRLVMQNMLEKGHDKAQAEAEVGTLVQILRYFGHGRLLVKDGSESLRLSLNFALSQ